MFVPENQSSGLWSAALSGSFVAVVTVLLTGLVGAGLTLLWNLRQKQRELDFAATEQFAALYGEFFATWKLWNFHLKHGGRPAGAIGPNTTDTQFDLLARATTAEAKVEAILIQLASRRDLTSKTVEELGRFRQGYQTLRETIRKNQPLDWNSSSHQEYATFKRLAAVVAALIQSGKREAPTKTVARANAWLNITSNKFEDFWIDRSV